MSEAVISLVDVVVNLGGKCILDRIHLDVGKDDFLGIIGPNGGGKTTLLRVMLGLQRVDRGSVRIHGRPVSSRETARIGYVPQFAHFDENFPVTVFEVALTGRLGKKPLWGGYDKHDWAITEAAIERVGLQAYRDQHVGVLSGGERQRLLIARALVVEPEILLLDESTSNVDQQFYQQFHALLKELHRSMPIVLVSHDIGALSTLVDRVACLNRQLFIHDSSDVSGTMLEKLYGCPVDLIAHGVPHRVLKEHPPGKSER